MLRDDYLTITQAAQYVNVTRQTIYRWVKRGLRSDKVGRVTLIKRDDIHTIVCPACGARRFDYERY